MEGVLLHGERGLAQTPRKLFSARTLAMLFVGGADVMRGDVSTAYEVLRRDAEDAAEFGYSYEMRRLGVLQFIQWFAGDLRGITESASQVLAWSASSISRKVSRPHVITWRQSAINEMTCLPPRACCRSRSQSL